MNNWWVYIIQCRNKSLYTGIITDVERRFDEYQNDDKKASKYCALKSKRMELARKRRVPAYIIFPDATLHQMLLHKPQTL